MNTDNKDLPDFTQHMKERAERLADFLGYVTPSLTSIDMREMYCQGYLQAIKDAKPSRTTIAAMCLQGILSHSEDRGTDFCARRSVELADALLFHLQNTEK